jgi:hypothetical protein
MHQIDSYLDAIRRLLPRQTRDDVVAELRDALLTEIESEETERGHRLTDAETDSLLGRFGAPRVVAARYGARSYLIGPRMFPVFVFVAKAIAVLIGVIAVIRIAVVAYADGPGAALSGVVIPAALMFLVLLTVVVIILARAERLPLPALPWETWIPRMRRTPHPGLPRLGIRPVVPRSETLPSLIWLTFWLVWWAGPLPLSDWLLYFWLPLQPAPIVDDLTPFVILLLAAGIAANAIALVQPRLARFHEAAQAAIGCGLLALIGVALRAGTLVVATRAGESAQKAASVTNIVWIVCLVGLAVVSIAYVVTIARCWIRATPGRAGSASARA